MSLFVLGGTGYDRFYYLRLGFLVNSLKLIISKKTIIAGIVIILALYWYSQQSSSSLTTQTEKANFDMNGTIENITLPCPFNVQCNPVYWLAAEDGNTYHLRISSGIRLPDGSQQICEGPVALQEPCLTRLPNRGQHIEVIGIETNDTGNYCEANGQAVPCQPIGTVMYRVGDRDRLSMKHPVPVLS